MYVLCPFRPDLLYKENPLWFYQSIFLSSERVSLRDFHNRFDVKLTKLQNNNTIIDCCGLSKYILISF